MVSLGSLVGASVDVGGVNAALASIQLCLYHYSAPSASKIIIFLMNYFFCRAAIVIN